MSRNPPGPLRLQDARIRHQRPSPHPNFLFGVAYYPEHWTAAERRQDVRRLSEAGINVVRMGEFAWDVWEPQRGAYAFDLFDRVIADLGSVGIRTILGTPTAAPPRWLTRDHPDVLRTAVDGQRTGHGGRQHVNPNHPVFRAVSAQLVAALAEHYANHPHVIGWQIDNEFHCIGATDFSPLTAAAFQEWLRHRYGRITVLNRRWGTRFNAGTFEKFEDIPLPLRDRPDGYPPHPGHLLDFHRFTSDVTCARLGEQIEPLRAANSDWLIIHNGFFRHLDYWKLGGPLDGLGIDLYPGFGGEGRAAQTWAALKLEIARAHSGSFIVPELASGAGGSRAGNLETPDPGQMRLWAWQSVAHGADGLVHFRWRTARTGPEMHWHGVMDHDNIPRRRFRELQQEADELQRLAPEIIGTVVDVKIGILIDFEADESHDAVTSVLPSPRHQTEHILAALLGRHLPAGLVHVRDDWTGLRTLFLPSFGTISTELAARLGAFVRRGGNVICTAGTGRRTIDNAASTRTQPGHLTRLLGVQVIEYGATRQPLLEVAISPDHVIAAPHGYEIIVVRQATTCGAWRRLPSFSKARVPHPAENLPALTKNALGRGHALLLGTWVDESNVTPFIEFLASELRWRSLVEAPAIVTAQRRISPGNRILFLLNHAAEPTTINRVPAGTDLLTGDQLTHQLTLPSYGVIVAKLV